MKLEITKRQKKKIEELQNSIAERIYMKGYGAINSFALIIERPDVLGRALSKVGVSSNDKINIFTGFLSANKQIAELSRGYIKALNLSDDIELRAFLNNLSDDRQIVKYYSILPISNRNLERIKNVELELQDEYWRKVEVTRLSNTDDELKDVINALCHVERFHEAIDILYFTKEVSKKMVEPSLICDTLLKCTQDEYNKTDSYELGILIKEVQNSDISIDKKLQLEWKYIQILVKEHDYEPRTIYQKLENDPNAFMELFSLIYRGKNQEKKVLTQQEESNITAVFSLLYSWKTIPGKKQDGTLNENKLTSWVNTVLTLAEKMDRTDITQHYIGSRLFYAPCDSDGFFINRSVAMMLQKNNHEEMRMGYLIEAKNARGTHIVDETGQAEFKLEKEYNEKADAAEREGFTRIARVLRLIADDYHSEGLANIEDARNRN